MKYQILDLAFGVDPSLPRFNQFANMINLGRYFYQDV